MRSPQDANNFYLQSRLADDNEIENELQLKTGHLDMAATAAGGDRRRTVFDLTLNQSVVIWSLRTWLDSADGPRRVHEAVQRALPPTAARIAVGSLARLVDMLILQSRRPAEMHWLGATALSRDEQFLVALMDAAERDLSAELRRTAAKLVAGPSVGPLIGIIHSLNATLHHRRAASAPIAAPSQFSTMVH